jgi:hypothetical protein
MHLESVILHAQDQVRPINPTINEHLNDNNKNHNSGFDEEFQQIIINIIKSEEFSEFLKKEIIEISER